MDAATFYPVVRGSFFIVLLLLVGTQTAARIARRRLGSASLQVNLHITNLLTPLALVLLALSAARALLQLWSLKDPSDALTWDFTEAVLLSGTWGISWLIQTAAALLLLLCALSAARSSNWVGSVIPVLVAAALWAQTGMGHAASSFWGGPLGRTLQVTHLLGGGLWLGTLGILAIHIFPLLRNDEELPQLAGVLQDFSVLARVGATLVVISGVLVALKYAGSLAAFLTSTWGRLLLFKVAGLGGVAALGWYNWRIVTPAVAVANAGCTDKLRRAVRLELALGLIMLGLTAFLVATQLPREI